MMRRSGDNGNDSSLVDVFAPVKLDGCVVNGVELKAEDAHGHLAGEASGEVVYEEMHVHDVSSQLLCWTFPLKANRDLLSDV